MLLSHFERENHYGNRIEIFSQQMFPLKFAHLYSFYLRGVIVTTGKIISPIDIPPC